MREKKAPTAADTGGGGERLVRAGLHLADDSTPEAAPPEAFASDPATERHAVAARVAIEVDSHAAFAIIAIGNNSRLGADVVRTIGLLLDQIDDLILELGDVAARVSRAKEPTP